MYSLSGHPRRRWVCYFIRTDLENFAWHHFLCKWMGAIRMRVQTADKNITIIHTTPAHQLISCKVKICVFVWSKSIIKALNCHFWPKYQSIIHYNTSFSEKAHPLLSSHIKIHRTVLGCFSLNSAWSVHISLLIQTRFFTGESNIILYFT